MNEYHKNIMIEKEKIRELERLKREHSKLSGEVRKLEEQEATHKKKLDEEQVDVEKLEGFSIAGVFMSIVGKKEEKLIKEKQEAATAHLKWKEAKQAKHDADEELHQLTIRIEALGNPQDNYDQLLHDKQNDLVMNDRQEGEYALKLLNDIANLKADIKEIHEAQQAGSSARNALDAALEALQKAKNWGTVDMFGGGLITTSIKHSNLDTAKEHVHQAQTLLRRFSNELDDIGQSFHVDVSISGGLTFMDYFFDGLLSDWLVQDKLNNSYDQVETMYRKTNDTLHQLDQLLSNTKETQHSLEQEWTRHVETA